jgi:histidine triad (HIT) family protein
VTTIFTKIIQGKLPSAKVYEDENVVAFMDAGRVNPGHVLIATRKPFETLMDADEEAAAAMMRAAVRIAKAVQAAFQPDGITLLQANKPAGWQTVPHLHMHVLPRYKEGGVGLAMEPGFLPALLVDCNNQFESACHPYDAHGGVANARDTSVSLCFAPCPARRTGAFHFPINCYSPLVIHISARPRQA